MVYNHRLMGPIVADTLTILSKLGSLARRGPPTLCALYVTQSSSARARARSVLISDHVPCAKWNDNDTVYRQRDYVSFLSGSISGNVYHKTGNCPLLFLPGRSLTKIKRRSSGIMPRLSVRLSMRIFSWEIPTWKPAIEALIVIKFAYLLPSNRAIPIRSR